MSVSADAFRAPSHRGLGMWGWLARLPWWLATLGVYAASRVVSLALFAWSNSFPNITQSTVPHPVTLFTYLSAWDGSWYHTIVQQGYPSQLPLNGGKIWRSDWAFYPLWPYLTKCFASATGVRWQLVAPLCAILAGAGAMLVLYRLMKHVSPLSPGLPLGTVTLVSFFPSSAVLSTAYAEALTLCGIVSFLYLLITRRYAWAGLLVIALGLTRPVVLPLALVVLAHGIYRWRRAQAHTSDLAKEDQFFASDALRIAALALVSCLSAVVWPAVAALRTGQFDAYLSTERAWQRLGVSQIPGFSWVQLARFPFALGLIVLVVASFAILFAGGTRRFHGELTSLPQGSPGRGVFELKIFGVVYMAYLVAVEAPSSSQFRFILLDFPVAAALWSLTRRRAWLRAVIIVLFIAAQALWVLLVWGAHAHLPNNPLWEWTP